MTGPVDDHPAAAHDHSVQDEHKKVERQAQWAERIERHEAHMKDEGAENGPSRRRPTGQGAENGPSRRRPTGHTQSEHNQAQRPLRRERGDLCNRTLFDASKDICFISGGMNPAKDGDKDHYGTQEWKDLFNKNDKPNEDRKDIIFSPNNTFPGECDDAFFCGVAGIYKGNSEGTIMVSCTRHENEWESNALKGWCTWHGAKLFQDSVLLRHKGTAELVQTFPESRIGSIMGTLPSPVPRHATENDEFKSKLSTNAKIPIPPVTYDIEFE